jgi:succinate dehydrogenase / fumarate reductase iron-sulfur subunit
MNFTLRLWRQKNTRTAGHFEQYPAQDINPDMSILEMLDVVNERLILEGKEPVAFDHDCREGICGMCSLVINGEAHGPEERVTSCQIYMRSFRDGTVITIEPFRSKAFPILKDLIVDRSALERIMQSGGFISVNTGQAPDANALPIGKEIAEQAFDVAHCIGCGACVAACKNSAAMLFVSAKVTHLGLLPQGRPEWERRVLTMVSAMDAEGFGNCTKLYECEAVCPKGISAASIARLNRDYAVSAIKGLFHRKSETLSGS